MAKKKYKTCKKCNYYAKKQDYCKSEFYPYIEDQGPDFGCIHWEKKLAKGVKR